MDNAIKAANGVVEVIQRFLPACAEMVNRAGPKLSPQEKHEFEFLFNQINAKHSELTFWLDNLNGKMKSAGM